jgi:tetratricopeptide (TPR) repeat protein
MATEQMANEPLDNESTANPEGDDEPTPGDSSGGSQRPGLIWRMVALVVALGVIFSLIYPLWQSSGNRSSMASPLSTPTLPAVSQSTAQANPNSPEAWFELGKTYYKDNQWDQAVAAFQKVIELNPAHQAAYANLGAAYHRLNQFDLATAQYKKALELKPDDGETVYNLAAVYLQQATGGRQPDPNLLQQAVDQLNRARQLSPDAAEPYFGLGIAYMLLNQRNEAIKSFETFIARDTGHDPRASQEAKRYLQALQGP